MILNDPLNSPAELRRRIYVNQATGFLCLHCSLILLLQSGHKNQITAITANQISKAKNTFQPRFVSLVSRI